MIARASLLFSLLLAAQSVVVHNADAQFATLRGRVVSTTNEAIDGVNVVLRGENGRLFGNSTQDGYYLITRIPAGRYALSVSFIGFVTITDTLSLEAGSNVQRNFVLEEDESQLGQVVVESERVETRDYIAGLRTIRGSDLDVLPGASLSRDLAGYLLTEAGVVTVGDRGGQLFVRGGTPSQNIFLLDGMRVFQPLHLINAYSIYPAEIVAFADVFSSGYGAYYGGRTGAVIDVSTRNGNKERTVGSLSVSPFLAAGHVETPIIKERVSFIASVRQSLLNQYGQSVISRNLPFDYGDRFFKLHGFVNETSNVSFTALRSSDRGNLAGDAAVSREIGWSNAAYGANYFYLSPELPVLTEITVGTTRFSTEKFEDEDVIQSASVEGIDASFNFGYLLGAYQVHFGIFAHTTKFEYSLGPRSLDRFRESVTEGGFFGEARLTPAAGWHFVPGFRIQTFPSRGQSYLEPRLRLSVPLSKLFSGLSLSGSWGIYHQQLVALTDDRSISEVFTAWAPSAQNAAVPRSVHYSLGMSAERRRWQFTVEAYRRTIENLGFPALGEPLRVGTRLLDISGFSRGIDTGVERRWVNAYLRMTYGLSQTEYDDGDRSFPPPHDRRHSLSTIVQYTWRGTRLSAQWQYGSGLPYTQINGLFQRLPVDPEQPVSDTVGDRELLFSESYGSRLPAYHRLDVTAERDFALPAGAKLTLQIAAINTYDRRNWFDLDYETLQRLNQLPFIPSVAAKVSLR